MDAASRRLDRLRVEAKDKRKVRDVKDSAAQVHTEVGKAMADAAPANQAEALRILDEQISRLDRTIDRCKGTFKALSQPDEKKGPSK